MHIIASVMSCLNPVSYLTFFPRFCAASQMLGLDNQRGKGPERPVEREEVIEVTREAWRGERGVWGQRNGGGREGGRG